MGLEGIFDLQRYFIELHVSTTERKRRLSERHQFTTEQERRRSERHEHKVLLSEHKPGLVLEKQTGEGRR